MLFIHGGPRESQRVYAEHERAYWSAALTVVLEKHGYLAVDTRGPEALGEPSTWQTGRVVLIARLPEDAWTSDALERLASSAALVLLEGPLPASVEPILGIRSSAPDDPDALVRTTDSSLRGTATALLGSAPNGVVGPSTAREIARQPELEWTELDVPIDARQARAWRARGWEACAWTVDAADVLAQWEPEGARPQPALIRSGTTYAFNFSAFAFVAQSHTAEPTGPREFRTSPRSLGVEALLLATIDELHMRAGIARHRVLPWPAGASWVLNVRHDFDRPLGASRVAQIVADHHKVGSAATWYWRACHLSAPRLPFLKRDTEGNRAIGVVSSNAHHEVALHSERLWNGAEDERKVIERVSGRRVFGASAHGNAACFRWQGAPNLLWAEHEGLDYNELIQHAHYHPHRFVTLASDGLTRPLRVICLPHHLSLDLGTGAGQSNEEAIRAVLPTWENVGGLVQIMNHPDLNHDVLFALLASLPRERRLNWTAHEAANWWRRTHTMDELSLNPVGETDVGVRARHEVRSLVVETRRPDGAVSRREVDAPGDS